MTTKIVISTSGQPGWPLLSFLRLQWKLTEISEFEVCLSDAVNELFDGVFNLWFKYTLESSDSLSGVDVFFGNISVIFWFRILLF